jgi:hypothetical protein
MVQSDNTLYGYDVVYEPTTFTDTTQMPTDLVDDDLAADTSYYYCAVLYHEPADSSYTYFSDPGMTQATTNARPDARISVNAYGILTVSEPESGYSEFQWELTMEDNNGNQEVLSVIPGSAAAGHKYDDDELVHLAHHTKEVAMNTGHYTLFGYAGLSKAVYIDGFDGFTEEAMQGQEFVTTANWPTEFSGNGMQHEFQIPQEAGATFSIGVEISELDPGGEADLTDISTFTFEFDDQETTDTTDDVWKLLSGGSSNLPVSEKDANSIGNTNQEMDPSTAYWFNPYYEHDEGDVEVFFQLSWEPVAQ